MTQVDRSVPEGEQARELRRRIRDLEASLTRITADVKRVIEEHHRGADPSALILRLERRVHGGSFWDKPQVVEKFHDWTERYGEEPASTDWSPAQARRAGRSDAEIARFYDGDYPNYSTVTALFKSWNGLRAEAGVEVKPPGGGHGKGGRNEDELERLPVWAGWRYFHGRRVQLALTQAEVAERSKLGLSTYSEMERGAFTNPTVRVLLAVSKGLELPPGSILESV